MKDANETTTSMNPNNTMSSFVSLSLDAGASAASSSTDVIFGSLQYSNPLFSSIGFGLGLTSSLTSSYHTDRGHGHGSGGGVDGSHHRHLNGQNKDDNALEESSLTLAIKPLRDRYLVGCLSRMNYPILQMFPEMEGYSGKSAHQSIYLF